MVITIIIVQGVIFIGLILILRHFMKGHVSGAVGHLQQLNMDMVKQQADLKEKLAAAETVYKEKMETMEKEIANKQAQVSKDANQALEESKSRALAEREKIINEAVETREKMRQEVMKDMEEKAINHSKEVIAAFLSGEIRKLVHEGLINDVVAGLKDIPMEQFQVKTDSVQLKVAAALSDSERKKVQKALKDKINKEVNLKEETDAALVAGLVLKFGTFVIDGSLTNRLQEAAAQLKKQTARKYQGTY